MPRRPTKILAAAGAALTVAGAAAIAGGTPAIAAPAGAGGHGQPTRWMGSWESAQVQPAASGLSATGFTDQTVRDIVHTSAGGSEIRIRISNVFGSAPLVVGDAHVAILSSPSTSRRPRARRPGTRTRWARTITRQPAITAPTRARRPTPAPTHPGSFSTASTW
jgi:hypothetical protein